LDKEFSFRVRFGDFEVEISGSRDEVFKTVEMLPSLMASVSKAFELAKTDKPISNGASSTYPVVSGSNCSEAVLKLLESDWGMEPRTLSELVDALKSNTLHYPSTTLSGVLAWLTKKGKVKRWKTDKGYVYAYVRKEEA
jgi:hypothetical protein